MDAATLTLFTYCTTLIFAVIVYFFTDAGYVERAPVQAASAARLDAFNGVHGLDMTTLITTNKPILVHWPIIVHGDSLQRCFNISQHQHQHQYQQMAMSFSNTINNTNSNLNYNTNTDTKNKNIPWNIGQRYGITVHLMLVTPEEASELGYHMDDIMTSKNQSNAYDTHESNEQHHQRPTLTLKPFQLHWKPETNTHTYITEHDAEVKQCAHLDALRHALLAPFVSDIDPYGVHTGYTQRWAYTVLVEGDGHGDRDLDGDKRTFQRAYMRYGKPVMEAIQTIQRVRTDSQVVRYGTIGERKQTRRRKHALHRDNEDDGVRIVTSDELTEFVGTHWRATPPLETNSIEIVVYEPKEETAIVEAGKESQRADSFIVPRWGAVFIRNPHTEIGGNEQDNADRDDVEKYQPVFEKFIAFVRNSFGMYDENVGEGLRFEHRASGALEWEMQMLMLARVARYINETERMLRKIGNQLRSVPRIPLSKRVAKMIDDATALLETAETHLAMGYLKSAVAAAGTAQDLASAAFFDSSMMPSQYFPEEYLFAVLAPLFLPLSIAVVSTLVKHVKKNREART